MNCIINHSLIGHPRSYHLSCKDCLFALVTGLSGAPYAKRHWELSRTSLKHAWGHKILAILEYTPLLGGLAALIERIVLLIVSRHRAKDSIHPGMVAQFEVGHRHSTYDGGCLHGCRITLIDGRSRNNFGLGNDAIHTLLMQASGQKIVHADHEFPFPGEELHTAQEILEDIFRHDD